MSDRNKNGKIRKIRKIRKIPYSKLDSGIRDAVRILAEAGIETFESCEGGKGHACPEPMIRFHGERDEGFRALAVALQRNLNVLSLRRVWSIEDGEPTGPCWELVILPSKSK